MARCRMNSPPTCLICMRTLSDSVLLPSLPTHSCKVQCSSRFSPCGATRVVKVKQWSHVHFRNAEGLNQRIAYTLAYRKAET
eukprot:1153059-Pelagomonas_calceolata.AAC.3